MILKIIEMLVFILIFSGLMWLLYRIFHTEWSFNKPLSEDDIKSFELKWSISLPEEYRKFLLTVGNGMKNSTNGFDPLWSWCQPYEEEDISMTFLSSEFNGKALLNQKLPLPGCIRICNAGCEHYLVIVVSGRYSGEIWYDSSVDGKDPYPIVGLIGLTIKFQDWVKSVRRYKSKHLLINGIKTVMGSIIVKFMGPRKDTFRDMAFVTIKNKAKRNKGTLIIYCISLIIFCILNYSIKYAHISGFNDGRILYALLLFWPYMILVSFIGTPGSKFLLYVAFLLFPSMVNSAIVTWIINMFRNKKNK